MDSKFKSDMMLLDVESEPGRVEKARRYLAQVKAIEAKKGRNCRSTRLFSFGRTR